MKKILIAGSLVFFLSVPKVQGVLFDKPVGGASLGSRKGFKATERDRDKLKGDYKSIIEALQLEWSSVNQVYIPQDPDGGNIPNWLKSKDSIAYIPGYIFSTAEDKEAVLESQVELLENFYKNKPIPNGFAKDLKPGDLWYMYNQLLKDIQDLKKHKSQAGYFSKAQAQLSEYIHAAEVACDKIFQELYKQTANVAVQKYQDRLQNELIDKVIKEVTNSLKTAENESQDVDVAVYQALLEDFQSIQQKIKNYKKRQPDHDKAIKLVQKDQAASDGSEQDMYDLVIKQLNLDKEAFKKASDDEKKGKLEDDDVKIVTSLTPAYNPRIKLEDAQAELAGYEDDKIYLLTQNSDEDSFDIRILNQKIEKMNKLIHAIKVKISKMETEVLKTIKDALVKSGGNKSKALESLLPAAQKTWDSYLGSLWDNTAAIEERINSIDVDNNDYKTAVRKEAAQKLFAEIQQGSVAISPQEDAVGAARVKLGSASVVNIPGALTDVVAAFLAKGNISIDKLPYTVQENLKITTQEASDRIVKIMENPKASDTIKLRQRQLIVNKLIDDITKICSPYLTGLSVAAWKSGDISIMFIDALSNKLLQSSGL